jgi:hypothetical protein
MHTALVVLIASLALLLAGCGSTIKPEGAAASVKDLVSKQTGFEPKDVKCPDGDYTAHLRVTKVEGDDVEFYIQTRPTEG